MVHLVFIGVLEVFMIQRQQDSVIENPYQTMCHYLLSVFIHIHLCLTFIGSSDESSVTFLVSSLQYQKMSKCINRNTSTNT